MEKILKDWTGSRSSSIKKNLDFAQLLMNLFFAKSKMTFYQLLMCIHWCKVIVYNNERYTWHFFYLFHTYIQSEILIIFLPLSIFKIISAFISLIAICKQLCPDVNTLRCWEESGKSGCGLDLMHPFPHIHRLLLFFLPKIRKVYEILLF